MSSQTWSAHSRSSLREQPEKLAWAVLLGSFLVFCIFLVTIPYGTSYFYEHGSLAQSARLDSTLGTLFFRSSRSAEQIAVTASRDNGIEGSIIEAGADATQGTITFFSDDEESPVTYGSIQLYRNTIVQMLRIRDPIFTGSSQPYLVRINLQQGQARIFNNSGSQRSLRVELETPHGVAIMDTAGAYKVQASASVKYSQSKQISTNSVVYYL